LPLPPRWRWKIDRLRERFSSTFGSREKQRRPRLCPACGTLVGSTANRCHVCGASLTFSMAAMSRSFSKYLPSESPATYLILGACGLLYGISLLLTIHYHFPTSQQGGGILGMLFGIGSVASPVLLRLGASLPLPLDLDQPWRFVTACFLHANLLHIGFNMWVLVDLGPTVEELYGSARFFFLYIVCGIGGYILSSSSPYIGLLRALGIASSGSSIGASGAIVGLIGILLAITYRRRSAGMQQLRSQLFRWVIYLVLWGFFFPGIDNMAHLGGGITGFILGKFMADRQPSTTEERKHAYALAWATAAVVLVSFGFMIFGFHSHLFLRGFSY
jgi:rhomboid protease GluP